MRYANWRISFIPLLLTAWAGGAYADTPFALARSALLAPGGSAGAGLRELQYSPDGRYLLYREWARSEASVVVAAVDGSSVRRLAKGGWQARWSPHGKRITFFRGREGKPGDNHFDLWSIRPDGTGLTRLLRDECNFAWAPDGSAIAYLEREHKRGSPAVWLMDPDGARRRPLWRMPAGKNWKLSWSPDGRQVCLWQAPAELWSKGERHGERCGYLVERATGRATRVDAPLAGAAAAQIALSPDGKRLAMLCHGPKTEPEPFDLQPGAHLRIAHLTTWVKELATGRWQQWDDRVGIRGILAWSPKGDRLAVGVVRGAECSTLGGFALFRADGERICREQEGYDATWSAGGGRLLYSRATEGHAWEYWVCDNAGQKHTKAGTANDEAGGASWAPNGMSLAVVSDSGKTVERVTLTR